MNTPPNLPGISSPCTGCGLCASICPHGCITMKESEDGFMVPVIDAARCTGCGACQKTCAKQEKTPPSNQLCKCYEFMVNDKQERIAASSGGFCAELARLIIRMGGVVFGVALGADFRARYIEVRSEEDLWKIRGSKYVQACPNDCFRGIAQRLKENKTVLFVGTSCQVRALKTRFPQASPRMISVDIACYGVPSYHLLDAYMRELNTGTDRVKQLDFKNKSRGWRNNSMRLIYESGKEIISPAGTDPFVQGFNSRLCLNSACYSCARNADNRYSDITCADYWGHKDKENDESHMGISCLICHTQPGADLVSRLHESASFRLISLEDATKNNGGLRTSHEPIPAARRVMLDLLKNGPITPAVRRYIYPQGGKRIALNIFGFRLSLPECIYLLLRDWVKPILKR